MKSSLLVILLSILLAAFQSCTVPKEARIKKRLDKKQIQKETFLYAYGDGVFGSTTIELHDDHSFVENSFGFCVCFYKWGKWTQNGEEFILTYENPNEVPGIRTLKIDKEKGSVLMSSEDGHSISLRLMIYKM